MYSLRVLSIFFPQLMLTNTPSSSGLTMELHPGAVLSNQELTEHFKVGNMGGMRRSRVLNCLVLISDPYKALYEDRWHGDIFHYAGEGQKGEQSFTRQNKTLRDARQLGIPVYLFEVFEPKQYTFIGQVEVVGEIYTATQPDVDGNPRNVLVFPLKVLGAAAPKPAEEIIARKQVALARAARRRNLTELRDRVMYAQGAPGSRTTTSSQFDRNQDVVEYVLRISLGQCQLCDEPAPFSRPSGEPYLEVHHVVWLARGGEDSVANAVALCPNCHRKMHILDDQKDVARLLDIAAYAAAGLK